jgi:hypothetical protein
MLVQGRVINLKSESFTNTRITDIIKLMISNTKIQHWWQINFPNEALVSVKKPIYSTFVNTGLWLVWHISFQPISIIFALFLLAGSLGIGLATTKTQSILVASTMHAIPNIIEYSPMSLIVTIPVWIYIFWS